MQAKPLTLEESARLETTRDLCAHCVHRPCCSLRKNPDGPIHQCSEYDDGSPPAQRHKGRLYSVPLAREDQAAPDGQTFLGLCMNCDLRHECTLPRAAGGVWHCEEYK